VAIPLESCAELPVAQVGGKAQALGRALEHGFPVPPGVVIEPHVDLDPAAVVAALGQGPFAVRSSSPHEDAEADSWAGQFLTRLGVGAAELPPALREVRRSGRSEAAKAYGRSVGAIPVLVQPMLAADAAGVMFTIDPRDGRDDRCVIEGISGLGDELAEGHALPARFVVDALSEEILETDNPTAVPLGAAQLAEVIALGLRVAEWRGMPLDIEWAWAQERAWLLQARPVTAAAWSPAPGQWTAANFKEVMPGVVTPLTASMSLMHDFPRAVGEFVADIGLARPGEAVTEGRRFYGHAYWRVDTVKERMLQLPGFRERSFDETIGIAPAYEGDGRVTRMSPSALRRALPALRALQRAYRREGPAAEAYRDSFVNEEAEWLAIEWRELSDREVAERVRSAVEQHWRTNHWAMRVSFLSEQAQDDLRGLLLRLAGRVEPPPSEGLLLSNLDEVATGAAARALSSLAIEAGQETDRVLSARGSEDLPERVRCRFEDLVRRFGYLAEADEELSLPRWDEDPAVPLALLKAAATSYAGGGATRARSALEEEQRLAAVAGWRAPSLRRKAARARRYAWWREELRDVLARTNRLTRRAFLAQGERWAVRRILERPEDVFWLEAGEVVAVLDGELDPTAAAARVEPRRRHADRFRRWQPPETLGAPSAERRAPSKENSDGSGVLRGTPCSTGVAEGPGAVLRSLEDAPGIQPGSILVLEYSNPGWTPVYTVAAGLITEEGGLLSHGSIVARERGLPAVIQVHRATELLRDGVQVRIDGDRGTVTVLDGGEAPARREENAVVGGQTR
jgi:phosphohistidine swiveling domain-containing protein